MSLNARRIDNKEGNQIQLILLAIDDITERKQAEQDLQKLNQELEARVSERTAELQQANTALLQDIEERKRLENQLIQAQKMESLGTLAGGIAHDFNNILNIIQGYTSLLSKHAAKHEEIAGPVDVIQETVKRASAVVQQLLTLARKTESKFEPVDANALLKSLMTLLRETFAQNHRSDAGQKRYAAGRDGRSRPNDASPIESLPQCTRCDAGRRQAHAENQCRRRRKAEKLR